LDRKGRIMQSLNRSFQPRRDPAPSRWAYKMQRLWLTPAFRVFMRFGLPVLVVALVSGIFMASQARREFLSGLMNSAKDQVTERPMFMVNLMSIDGASPELADAVRAKLALKLPQSALELDLDAIRITAENLDAVARAVVRFGAGNVLQITITEREPAFVWRTNAGLMLLDGTGHRIAALAERADRADLPLIAGEGADQSILEAKALLQAASPLESRIRGLVRIGTRRWDLALDRDQRVLLPADNPVAAVEGLIALNAAENILARDLLSVDLRNPQRPVLRLAPAALDAFRAAHGITVPTESKS
jgi:cell division protein FtsQ